jgi:ABC-type branched-subunit amino acid transport system permease subunit
VAFAFIGMPFLVDEYMFRAILTPFLILALAAIGVNIPGGVLRSDFTWLGAFMAVGAYAAYNTQIRIEGMPLILALLSGGFFATLVGIFFGIPSLRVKGLYLAVATLAAQFFCRLGVPARGLVHQPQPVGVGIGVESAGAGLDHRHTGRQVPVLPGLRGRFRVAGQEPGSIGDRARVDGDPRHGRRGGG